MSRGFNNPRGSVRRGLASPPQKLRANQIRTRGNLFETFKYCLYVFFAMEIHQLLFAFRLRGISHVPRFAPITRVCRICKSKVNQEHHYCQECAFKKGELWCSTRCCGNSGCVSIVLVCLLPSFLIFAVVLNLCFSQAYVECADVKRTMSRTNGARRNRC